MSTMHLFGWSENVLRCVLTEQAELQPSSWYVKPGGGESALQGVWDGETLTITKNGEAVISLHLALAAKDKVSYDTNGEAPIVKRVVTVDGERNFVQNLAPHVVGTTWEANVTIGGSGRLFGLGQGEDGVYEKTGVTYYLYQHNMRIPMPFVLSPEGWAIYVDCSCLMKLEGRTLTLDAVQQLDFYVITGTPDACIASYRAITGKAAMLPKWAFGYIQSREAYRTQQELLDVATVYRSRNIPLDCIVQDWNTWRPGRWGEKILDSERYPDMKAASDALHGQNIHTLVSIWPNMNSGTADQIELDGAGKLLYELATYDAFDEEARAIYWKQMNDGLFSKGFDGWWCDSTEPFSGPDWGGETRRSEAERFRLVGEEHQKYLGQERANAYALAHAMGVYKNQRKCTEEKRVVNLTRSGWAGSQQYGTILWSGDISARWDVLRQQIAEGLSMSISGHPYWTFDIGAFFVVNTAWQKRGCGCHNDPEPKWFWKGGYNDGVEDPAYRELYIRWMQLGCFMPIFRSHGTDTPREIWNFGEPGSRDYEAIADTIRLRYRLMPYVYSLAGAAWHDDAAILRPLFFDFLEDVQAYDSEEFLFGPALLVCPVTEPMYAEDRTAETGIWNCHLPAGAAWYDLYTGARYKGGQDIKAAAPLDKTPVFVRAGSILPVTEGLQYACQTPERPVELLIYPGADGSFVYYDDAGDGYGYENGEYLRIPMQWNDAMRTLTLDAAEGNWQQCVNFTVILDDAAVPVAYAGEKLEVKL